MDDDVTKKFYALEAAEEDAGVAKGKADAEHVLARVRAGDGDASELYWFLKEAAGNSLVPYRLKGVAVALTEAIRKT